MSQPSARQVASRSRSASRWAGVKRRWLRPRSRISLSPPRTAGRMLGGAGQPSGLGGGEGVAGELVARDPAGADQVRGGEVGPQRVQAHRDDERRGIAAVDREPRDVDGLQELAQRFAHPARVGQPGEQVSRSRRRPGAGGRVLAGVRVGLEVGGEPVAAASGSRPEIRVVPSPRRRIVNRVNAAALASSSANRRASASSAISGATTSRIRRPSRPSSFGPNTPACADEVRLGLGDRVGGHARRAARRTHGRSPAPGRG